MGVPEGWFMEETCHSVGTTGGCGHDCPVYQRGDCEEPPEPYVWICVDGTGVALTEGDAYEVISKEGGMVKICNDEGVIVEFFHSRFDLDLPE